MALLSWDPAAVVDLLAPTERRAVGGADDLAAVATGLRDVLPFSTEHSDAQLVALVGDALVDAFADEALH